MIAYMLFSFFLLFYVSWYVPFLLDFSFPILLSLCHQVYSKCVILVVCYRYTFLFSFLDSSNPKDLHYPIYSSCFVMYESVASDISLISIGALSFEINHLYRTTFDQI
jgi:hypothetical protein